MNEVRLFLYPGNDKFLISNYSKAINSSSLWIVDRNTYQNEIFTDIEKNNAQSVAFGCDQGNGSLIVVALKHQSLVVKDMKIGVVRK